MTHFEWEACANPASLWDVIWPPDCDDADYPSSRQVLLYGSACWRRVWSALTQRASRRVVEVAELYADAVRVFGRRRQALERKRARVRAEATAVATALLATIPLEPEIEEALRQSSEEIDPGILRHFVSVEAYARSGARAASNVVTLIDGDGHPNRYAVRSLSEEPAMEAGDLSAERRAHCSLLRCIFGPVFRRVTLGRRTLPPGVVQLAHAAYQERDLPSGTLQWSRLAVLSDALEETGCDDGAILSHLRSAEPHVRGCWVLDLILGKR